MKSELKILIVEDCGVMQSVIRRTLQISGISVSRIDLAEHGKEGLKFLELRLYDLIILDINMPVMNGAEMIQEIRKHPEYSEIPIIIVSADRQAGRIYFYNDENFEFIQKPFMPEELRKKVISVLNGTISSYE